MSGNPGLDMPEECTPNHPQVFLNQEIRNPFQKPLIFGISTLYQYNVMYSAQLQAQCQYR